MKLIKTVVVCAVALFTSLALAEQAPDSFKQLAPTLKAWGENPVVIAAVKVQNAEGQTLDKIKQRDAAWRDISGVDDFMKSLLENDAGKELARLEASKPYFFEVFLMDNQGANVQ